MRYLLDTSALIDLDRKKGGLRPKIQNQVRAGEILTFGIVRVEFLRGLVNPRRREKIATLFDIMSEIPATSALWRLATQLAWDMDRKGRPIPATDISIAAAALSAGVRLVSPDAHFREIPGLEVLPELPLS
ncbi:MAG: PIN domain-containing protein [Verrucomicrobiota bacterium]